MKFRKCENCCQLKPGQFVNDGRTEDWICTLCGVVVRKWIYSERQNTFMDSAPTAKAGVGGYNLIQRMTNKMCVEENRELLRNRTISRFAFELDFNERVANRAQAQVNNFEELRTRRPMKETMLASLIVAKRSLKEYVNVKAIGKRTMMRDLGQHVIAVCKIIGLSQRSDPLLYVHSFVSFFTFPYSYHTHISSRYSAALLLNGSMGTDTLMALVLYRFYEANKRKCLVARNITLDDIAAITFTSPASLQGYVNGTGGKCTLFTKIAS